MKHILPIAVFATMLTACGNNKNEAKTNVPIFDTIIKTKVDTFVISNTPENKKIRITTSYDTIIEQRTADKK